MKIPHKTIVQELASNSESQRRRALRRLSSIPEDADYEDVEYIPNKRALRKYVPQLAQLLCEHPSLEVRTWCAQYISDIGNGSADTIEALCKSLSESHTQLVVTCVTALGNLQQKSSSIVDELLRLSSHPEPRIRSQVAWAVEQIGVVSARSMKKLIQMLEDQDGTVRYMALRAIRRVSKPRKSILKKLEEISRNDDHENAQWEAHYLLEEWGTV